MDGAETDGGATETNRRRGPAAFAPTDAQRATVRDLVALKALQSDIAAALGISLPTLRKYFAADLVAPEEPAGPDLFDAAALAPSAPAPPPSRKRARRPGRPKYRPSDRDRDRVMAMAAGGSTPRAIAKLIGISEPTLRKSFAAELDIAIELKRAEKMEQLDQLGRAGNVTALKTYIELCDRAQLHRTADRFTQPGDDQPRSDSAPSSQRLGKKAQALVDAQQTAESSDWADLIGHVAPPGPATVQ